MGSLSRLAVIFGAAILYSTGAMAFTVQQDEGVGSRETELQTAVEAAPSELSRSATVNTSPDKSMLRDLNNAMRDNRKMRLYQVHLIDAGKSNNDVVNERMRGLDVRFQILSTLGAAMIKATSQAEVDDLDEIAKAVLTTKGPVERLRAALADTLEQMSRLGATAADLALLPTQDTIFDIDH
jgi:hypothetical protein